MTTRGKAHDARITLDPRRAILLVGSVGFFSQIAQIVLFREMLAACRGTELFIGMVLAGGLFWTALGTAAMELLLHPRRGRQPIGADKAAFCAFCLLALNGLLLCLEVVIVRLASGGRGAGGEIALLHAIIVAWVAVAPVSLVSGAAFAVALRTVPQSRFPTLYRADACGAALAGAAFAFAIAGHIDPLSLGPLTAALSAVLLWRNGSRPTAIAITAAASACLGGLLFTSKADEALQRVRWKSLHPGYRLLATCESRYGQIAVLQHPAEQQTAVYLDTVLTGTLPSPGGIPVGDRNRALLVAAQHPSPRRILLVGNGLGAFPAELSRAAACPLDVVELDPQLIRTAREYGRSNAPKNVHLVLDDGRRFVRHSALTGKQAYDIAVVCMPTPVSAFVNRYFTVEFFADIARTLSPDGVLVTEVMAAANYPGDTVCHLSATVLRSLEAVFPEMAVIPGETHLFVAAKRPGTSSLDPAVLGDRLAGRGLWYADFDPDFREIASTYFAALLENRIPLTQIDPLRARLEREEVSLNTDSHPVAYRHALLVWNQMASMDSGAGLDTRTTGILRMLLNFRLPYGLVLASLLLLPAIILRLRRIGPGSNVTNWRMGYGVMAAAFATGLFGMVTEMGLIYAFQSTYGYAYHHIGIIVAAFMAGLVFGSWATDGTGRFQPSLGVVLGATCLFCLTTAWMLHGTLAWMNSIPSGLLYFLFIGVVAVAGFLDGATFPPLVRLLDRQGFTRGGGWVYAGDLAGAALGAATTGAVLIPTVGYAGSFLLAATVVGMALLVLLLAGARTHTAMPLA